MDYKVKLVLSSTKSDIAGVGTGVGQTISWTVPPSMEQSKQHEPRLTVQVNEVTSTSFPEASTKAHEDGDAMVVTLVDVFQKRDAGVLKAVPRKLTAKFVQEDQHISPEV